MSLLPGLARKRESFLCQGARDCSSGAAAHVKATFWGFKIYIKCEFHLATTPFRPQQDQGRINPKLPLLGRGARGKSVGSDFCAAGIISVSISLG